MASQLDQAGDDPEARGEGGAGGDQDGAAGAELGLLRVLPQDLAPGLQRAAESEAEPGGAQADLLVRLCSYHSRPLMDKYGVFAVEVVRELKKNWSFLHKKTLVISDYEINIGDVL